MSDFLTPRKRRHQCVKEGVDVAVLPAQIDEAMDPRCPPANDARPEDLPQTLEFFSGNSMWGSERVYWDGAWVVSEPSGLGRPGPTRGVPPASAWRAFWKRLDELDVWSWQARYDGPRPGSPDSNNAWGASIVHGRRSVSVTAQNAQPPKSDAFREAMFALFAAGCPSAVPKRDADAPTSAIPDAGVDVAKHVDAGRVVAVADAGTELVRTARGPQLRTFVSDCAFFDVSGIDAATFVHVLPTPAKLDADALRMPTAWRVLVDGSIDAAVTTEATKVYGRYPGAAFAIGDGAKTWNGRAWTPITLPTSPLAWLPWSQGRLLYIGAKTHAPRGVSFALDAADAAPPSEFLVPPEATRFLAQSFVTLPAHEIAVVTGILDNATGHPSYGTLVAGTTSSYFAGESVAPAASRTHVLFTKGGLGQRIVGGRVVPGEDLPGFAVRVAIDAADVDWMIDSLFRVFRRAPGASRWDEVPTRFRGLPNGAMGTPALAVTTTELWAVVDGVVYVHAHRSPGGLEVAPQPSDLDPGLVPFDVLADREGRAWILLDRLGDTTPRLPRITVVTNGTVRAPFACADIAAHALRGE